MARNRLKAGRKLPGHIVSGILVDLRRWAPDSGCGSKSASKAERNELYQGHNSQLRVCGYLLYQYRVYLIPQFRLIEPQLNEPAFLLEQ